MPIKNIKDLNKSDIEGFVSHHGEARFRADQIWDGLYRRLIKSPHELNIPKNIRDALDSEFSFQTILPQTTVESDDQLTHKTLFSLSDNLKIETVLMQYDKRNTVCISTQVGCAMGCGFCATGQMGFFRNLTVAEIIDQVIYYQRLLTQNKQNITNVVVMGMGEPFHNYENTIKAIYRLSDPEGLNIGTRRFTISTVGLVPVIRRFADEKHQINLAISLHSADDNIRSSLLPINRKFSVDQLIEACKYYVDITHRRITFEWALIDGINDNIAEAKKLVEKLSVFVKKGSCLCHVNSILLNPTPFYKGKASLPLKAREFMQYLLDHGIPCTVRLRRGINISAGCGQLVTQNKID